ncbi:MAG: oligosaccharide flippase family protein [Nanoarchaeota archaeon]
MFEKIKKDVLIRGSLVMFVMLGIFNVLNYVFQMSMARMLGPADYGILAVLMSLLYIFGIPNEAIQTIITRYASKFEMKKDFGKTKYLLYKSLKKGLIFSAVIFCIFLIISVYLSGLLHINFWLLAMTGLFIFYVFTLPVIRGVLQGRKKFFSLGLNSVLEALAKVVFSIFLVLFGLKVYGAMGGVVVGGILAAVLAVMSIKEVIKSKMEKINFEGVYRYNLPVLIGVSAIVLIYSIDVIMARIFFTPEIAGKYAFVSLIGKVVLFSSFAISKAMFPLTSENFERGIKTSGLLKKSLILVSAVALIMLAVCFFIPEKVISVISLGSSQYLDASGILFIVCLAFSVTAFTNVIVLYSLSINKIRKSSVFLLFFVLAEAILLGIFNSNLYEFSVSILIVNLGMFFYSLWLIKK